MKTVEKIESRKAKLSGAYYTIERAGQEPAYNSDFIKVAIKIFLPAKGGSILQELQFEKRVEILGEYLRSNWGFGGSETYRIKQVEKSGRKWTDLFEVAAAFAVAEKAKLETALEQRAQALIDAES